MGGKKMAENTLLDFITEMNKWEKECNKIEDNDNLDDDEQFDLQKKLLLQIFDKYCTKKERLNGRPNTISCGVDGPYEYDPKQEKVIEVTEDKENRVEINTNRKYPMNENFAYVLLKKMETGCLILKNVFPREKRSGKLYLFKCMK